MVGGLMRLLLSSALAWGAGCLSLAYAQGQSDPTRPAIVESPAVAASGSGAQVEAPSGLQSIIRRKGMRPAAIVHGQFVELGGKVGDAKLVQVNDADVVLAGPAGREELRLTPAVEKTTPVMPQNENIPERSRKERSRGKK